jgi:hypothetical protein
MDVGGGNVIPESALRALVARTSGPVRDGLEALLPKVDEAVFAKMRVVRRPLDVDRNTEFCVWVHPHDRLYAGQLLEDGGVCRALVDELERCYGRTRLYGANHLWPAILHVGSRS